jgi:hypothetical protein
LLLITTITSVKKTKKHVLWSLVTVLGEYLKGKVQKFASRTPRQTIADVLGARNYEVEIFLMCNLDPSVTKI